ncbi:MAG: SRPBCC family protein [Bacteroidetes bacterium]|nr:SRPBCC family protein [Bacteroidota bacterium]
MENQKSSTTNKGLHLRRTLNAPIDLVWEVWTKPEHIAQWWGPNGFTNTISKMDVQAGGEWNLVMHGPDGTDYDNRVVFREVVQNKKIVYEHINWPKFMATVEFDAQGEQTEMSWKMEFESEEEFIQVVKKHGAEEGQKENVVKLDAYLQKMKH